MYTFSQFVEAIEGKGFVKEASIYGITVYGSGMGGKGELVAVICVKPNDTGFDMTYGLLSKENLHENLHIEGNFDEDGDPDEYAEEFLRIYGL